MPPFICWFQYAVKLKLLHIGVVHVVLGVSDHALYHFAADGTGLTGSKIAVVALLQINVKGVGNFSLEVLQLLAVLIIACNCVFHLLFFNRSIRISSGRFRPCKLYNFYYLFMLLAA